MIKGQTVTLHVNTKKGEDPFGKAIYETSTIEVENVLCEPAGNDAIIAELQNTGKHLTYILHIPKGDTNDWKDTVVEFNGEKWQTYGDHMIYDAAMTPLSWNKKVKVERFG